MGSFFAFVVFNAPPLLDAQTRASIPMSFMYRNALMPKKRGCHSYVIEFLLIERAQGDWLACGLLDARRAPEVIQIGRGETRMCNVDFDICALQFDRQASETACSLSRSSVSRLTVMSRRASTELKTLLLVDTTVHEIGVHMIVVVRIHAGEPTLRFNHLLTRQSPCHRTDFVQSLTRRSAELINVVTKAG